MVSGLVYLNNRYHDPLLGTFISVDPLVTTTWEPYTYASANPATLSDPLGLCAVMLHDGERCYDAIGRHERGRAGAVPPTNRSRLQVVPTTPSPRPLPSGPDSQACLGPVPEANVNCFIDGVNGNGGAEAPYEDFSNLGGPGLPRCLADVDRCIADIQSRAAELYDAYDLDLRAELNAPFTRFGEVLAAVGGSCGEALFGLTVCTGAPHMRGGTTIGEVYLTDGEPRQLTPDRLWHESIHAWQTAAAASLGISVETYLLVYVAAGSSGRENEFEIQAGLCVGGYGC